MALADDNTKHLYIATHNAAHCVTHTHTWNKKYLSTLPTIEIELQVLILLANVLHAELIRYYSTTEDLQTHCRYMKNTKLSSF